MNNKLDWDVIVLWHKELCNDKGKRAALKRCKNIADIFLEPAYVDLIRKIKFAATKDTLPIIAGVLAHVDYQPENISNKYPKLAVQMAKAQDKPIISPIRFRRLLSCDDKDLFRCLIRIVNMQIKFFNIADFARDIYFWNAKNNRSKKEWAFDYYGNLSETFTERK